MEDAWRAGLLGQARLLAEGRVSAVELADLALARIERLNPRINAVVTLNPAARDDAAASDARRREGRALGPLDGVPMTVKDSIPVAGLPCTWGSRMLAGFVPERDELPVARLRAAGAVIVGKTNVPEFTVEGMTRNDLFGISRNPWNTDTTPGGSSGGQAAAVAAGLSAWGIGTDGGGSIRRPSAHNGLVGLKPTNGRVARCDSLPAIMYDFEVIGPMARSVGDAATGFAAMAGPDVRDPASTAFPPAPAGSWWEAAPTPQRILYVPVFADAPVEPAVRASVDRAAERLAGLGHHVETGPVPFDHVALAADFSLMVAVGVATFLEAQPAGRDLVQPRYLDVARIGAGVPATKYWAALQRIFAFRRTIAERFRDVDVVLTPSIATVSWPVTEWFPTEIDGRPVGPRGHAVYTGWVNACGYPGLDLPAEPSPGGLPIGFQLVGRPGSEETLLRIGRQYEAAHPWADRWPALALA